MPFRSRQRHDHGHLWRLRAPTGSGRRSGRQRVPVSELVGPRLHTGRELAVAAPGRREAAQATHRRAARSGPDFTVGAVSR